MAKGKTHFRHSQVLAATAEAGGWYVALFTGEPIVALCVTIGNLLGMFLTPDMDDAGTTYPEYLLGWLLRQVAYLLGARKAVTLRNAERMGKKAFAATTAPYGVFIPHRSWLSHVPPFGVLTKAAYLYVVYYILSCVMMVQHVPIETLYNSEVVWYTVCVWIVHDTWHLVDDGGMVLFNGKQRYLFGYAFYSAVKARNDAIKEAT